MKKLSLLTVKDLSQSFIDKTLYEDANFVLNKEDHMGVTGQNGVGKSTLIKILTGDIIPDEGQVKWQNKVSVGYLDQYAKLAPGVTIRGFLRTAFDELYTKEKEPVTLIELCLLKKVYRQLVPSLAESTRPR